MQNPNNDTKSSTSDPLLLREQTPEDGDFLSPGEIERGWLIGDINGVRLKVLPPERWRMRLHTVIRDEQWNASPERAQLQAKMLLGFFVVWILLLTMTVIFLLTDTARWQLWLMFMGGYGFMGAISVWATWDGLKTLWAKGASDG